ncbi:MAG: pirin family protein [Myxococcota bacterium]
MMKLRNGSERGRGRHGWLDSHHTFSFAGYYDPRHMGHRGLRVINEDRVAAGAGFGTHPHQDMEILSYVVDGALEHKDSMGTGSVIRPGDVQRMSAGTGVLHSEYNASKTDPVHFLQIWIEPRDRGIEPSYAQKDFTRERRDALALVASADGREGSLTLNRDTDLYASELAKGQAVEHRFANGGHGWVQVVRGALKASSGEHTLVAQAGDGIALDDAKAIRLEAEEDAEFLLFDLD